MVKWLSKLADLLPDKMYQALHKLAAPVYTDSEGNVYTEEMEKEGVKRRAVWQYVGEHPANHKRRMLKMWDQFQDIRIIDLYMRQYGGITILGRPEEVEEDLTKT